MRAIKGLFDGKNFIALEKFPKKKKYKVVITFIEEIDNNEEIRNFSAQTSGLLFWEDGKEDIYQEYLEKK